MQIETKIAIFKGKGIRKIIRNDEWWFSVVDVVESLTDSSNATDYLKKLRKRDVELGLYIGTNCPQIEMITQTGKKEKLSQAMPNKSRWSWLLAWSHSCSFGSLWCKTTKTQTNEPGNRPVPVQRGEELGNLTDKGVVQFILSLTLEMETA